VRASVVGEVALSGLAFIRTGRSASGHRQRSDDERCAQADRPPPDSCAGRTQAW
jgi:hypothetical protein